MALTRSIPSQADPAEDPSTRGTGVTAWRKVQASSFARDVNGNPREGVLDPDPSTPLVTGTTSMAYLIKGGVGFVTQRVDDGGVERSFNDAVDSVDTTAAPGSNSRIDVIWVLCQFDMYTDDDEYSPTFGVTQGAAASSPTKPSIPTGATELATAVVTSSDVTTATVVITQTAPFTAMAGGVVPVRNSTELAAWSPADGAHAVELDSGRRRVRRGGVWAAPGSITQRACSTSVNLSPEATMLWQTSIFDEIPDLSYSAGVFTASRAMKLKVKVTVGAQFASTYFNLDLRRSGTKIKRAQGATSSVAYTTHALTDVISLTSGQTVDVRAWTGASCGLTVSDGGVSNITNILLEEL